jgi:hypothetical protein
MNSIRNIFKVTRKVGWTFLIHQPQDALGWLFEKLRVRAGWDHS